MLCKFDLNPGGVEFLTLGRFMATALDHKGSRREIDYFPPLTLPLHIVEGGPQQGHLKAGERQDERRTEPEKESAAGERDKRDETEPALGFPPGEGAGGPNHPDGVIDGRLLKGL
jgi:hypothetical protein